jgi:hypothetical protein
MRFNEAELRADFPNQSRLTLAGADSPDTLRGIYCDAVVFDEYSQMSPRIYSEVILPALSDRNGYVLFIGTPQGHNHFHELWIDAEDDPDWFRAMYKASDTGLVNERMLAQARKQMTEEQYAQEYECSFSGVLFGSYYGKLIEEAIADGRIGNIPPEPALPVHLAFDIGIHDETSIWFMQQMRGGGINVIDYMHGTGEGIEFYLRQLQRKPYHYGTLYVPHDFEARSFAAGRSPADITRAAGYKLDVVPRMSPLERIQAVRTVLPLCSFDKRKTRAGVDGLRNYHREFDEKRNTFKSVPVHDDASHPADAFGCFAVAHTGEHKELRFNLPPRRNLGAISHGWMAR